MVRHLRRSKLMVPKKILAEKLAGDAKWIEAISSGHA
jgi:hypothetical protein